jgi:hypothetical protein
MSNPVTKHESGPEGESSAVGPAFSMTPDAPAEEVAALVTILSALAAAEPTGGRRPGLGPWAASARRSAAWNAATAGWRQAGSAGWEQR